MHALPFPVAATRKHQDQQNMFAFLWYLQGNLY